jgi:116 kDa U5 small nuclear ribonucleoprotein component
LGMPQFLGEMSGFVDMCVDLFPPANSKEAITRKLQATYQGSLKTPRALAMIACDASGPLTLHVSKLFPSVDAQTFYAFARVFSGTLKPGQVVRIAGENYSAENTEDIYRLKVGKLFLYQSRYRVEITQALPGMLVLISDIDGPISKTATIVDDVDDGNSRSGSGAVAVSTFSPLAFYTKSVVKVAIEPLNPAELPKMLEGLRKVNKSYPLVSTRVEESGEHTLLGPGELYLDSVMHDLREMYANAEIKISDPLVSLCETVTQKSALKCYADTANKKNRLVIIAEPLERGLAEDLESSSLALTTWPTKQISKFLKEKYDWDALATRSLWGCGAAAQGGPNMMLDDTLPTEVDKTLLGTIKASIMQGFRWCTREGPLCEEPVRGVKFRLVEASIASEPIFRGGGYVIPAARRVCYAAMLTATPRLMEPIYLCEIVTPAECMDAISKLVRKRRGQITSDVAKGGTALRLVHAYMPMMDAFGFDADIRILSLGGAYALLQFDHWAIVPGDPLDKSIVLHPLQPAITQHIAREFMLKTRRRKGLAEDVAPENFFDDVVLLEMYKQTFSQVQAE